MKVIRDAGYQDGYDVGAMLLQVSKNFNGGTSHPLTMSDAYFDEEKCVAGMKERNYVSGVCMFHINKASIYLFHEEYESPRLSSPFPPSLPAQHGCLPWFAVSRNSGSG